MTFERLLQFIFIETILCLSPGPAVMLIFAQGMSYGIKKSIMGIIGILAGNIVYYSVSGIIIGASIVLSEKAFTLLKIPGVIYIFYLGLKIFHEKANEDLIRTKGRVLFFQGFLTQLLNVKAILVFISIYPQFIDASRAVFLQILVLAVASITIEFHVLLGYAWYANRSQKHIRNTRFGKYNNKIAGVVLIAAALIFALK